MNGILVTYDPTERAFDFRVQVEVPVDDKDAALATVEAFALTMTHERDHTMHAAPKASLAAPWGDDKVCRVYSRFTVKAL